MEGDLDSSAPRRAELLAEIQRAQEVRADARRDLAEGAAWRAQPATGRAAGQRSWTDAR